MSVLSNRENFQSNQIEYNKGYDDCHSELSFKIKSIIKFHLVSKDQSENELIRQITNVLDGVVISGE